MVPHSIFLALRRARSEIPMAGYDTEEFYVEDEGRVRRDDASETALACRGIFAFMSGKTKARHPFQLVRLGSP